MIIYGQPVTFCGDNPPPNYRVYKNFVMILKTDASLSRRGFRVSYEEEYCGGEMTTEGEIQSLARNMNYINLLGGYPLANLYCVWNITAPPKKLIVLR